MIYYGVVEDRASDPLKLGRCRVRISGVHTENKQELPTEDLPWALVMQPTTSGAISGIGYSPTGMVEGTWVMVVFRDEYKQCPVIIGTLPGIPTKEEPQAPATESTPSNAIRSGDGSVLTDGSGQPVTSGDQELEKKKPLEEPSSVDFKKPAALSISQNGLDFLAREEGLASVSQNQRSIAKNPTSLAANTPIYPYKDTKGIWTIGWGFIYLRDGSRVNETSRMTKGEADQLKKDMLSGKVKIPDFIAFEPYIRKNIKVPLTQSMYDACISMAYNMGAGGFVGSPVGKALNAGKYEEAAGLILVTKTSGGLEKRRQREKALFIKDGIPQDDGSTKQIPSEATQTTATDQTQNPVVKRKQTDETAKTDGDVKQLSEPGFSDPNRVFPRYFNEPDVHRLARHEKIDGTIVFKKEAGRATSVVTAAGSTWSQPPIPYNSKYPYNRVYASESGHVQEFDDTAGNERIHTYHKSGTYSEIDCNGTQVNRIVGDSFQIIERNGNVVIRGACNITVQGDCNIKSDYNTNVYAGGALNLRAGGTVGIKAGGDIILDAGGAVRSKAGGEVSLDGSAVHLNSGKGASAPGMSNAASGAFPVLSTPNRFADLDTAYETPEDGEPSESFKKKQVESGTVDPDAEPAKTETEEEVKDMTKVEGDVVSVSCDLIFKETAFSGSYRLSTNFTLSDIIKGTGAEIPNGNTTAGTSASTIVCNLKHLCVNILEPVKKRYPNMVITNTYRSDKHNARVGGAKKSQHSFGEAADIQFSGFSRKQLYDTAIELQKLLSTFDQLILEYRGASTWLHISNKIQGNRKQSLTIDATSGKNVTINRSGFTLLKG